MCIRDSLETVARLLCLNADHVAVSLDAAKAAATRPVGSAFTLAPGDLVCLTGQMTHPREVIEALLVERGLRVGGLTQQTRLLVAADPDSLSGKAKKARLQGADRGRVRTPRVAARDVRLSKTERGSVSWAARTVRRTGARSRRPRGRLAPRGC